MDSLFDNSSFKERECLLQEFVSFVKPRKQKSIGKNIEVSDNLK
jgi:hypothetical protein